jgi:hypothetical protein
LRDLEDDGMLNTLRSIEGRLQRLDELKGANRVSQSPSTYPLQARISVNWSTPLCLQFFCPMQKLRSSSHDGRPIMIVNIWGKRGWCKHNCV